MEPLSGRRVTSTPAWLGPVAMALAACGGAAEPELTIRDAFTIPGTGTLAVYLDVANDGGQDKLLAANLPDHPEATVSLHRTRQEEGRAVMEPVDELAIPGDDPIALEPRDAHLMVEGLTDDLEPGDQLRMRVRFDRSTELDVEVEVVPVDDALERMRMGSGT